MIAETHLLATGLLLTSKLALCLVTCTIYYHSLPTTNVLLSETTQMAHKHGLSSIRVLIVDTWLLMETSHTFITLLQLDLKLFLLSNSVVQMELFTNTEVQI